MQHAHATSHKSKTPSHKTTQGNPNSQSQSPIETNQNTFPDYPCREAFEKYTPSETPSVFHLVTPNYTLLHTPPHRFPKTTPHVVHYVHAHAHGSVAERTIAPVLKTGVSRGTVGSNPTTSAKQPPSTPVGNTDGGFPYAHTHNATLVSILASDAAPKHKLIQEDQPHPHSGCPGCLRHATRTRKPCDTSHVCFDQRPETQ